MANITITQNGANSQVNVNSTTGNKIIIDVSNKNSIICSFIDQGVNINWHDLSLDEKAYIIAVLTSITNIFSESFEKDKLNQDYIE